MEKEILDIVKKYSELSKSRYTYLEEVGVQLRISNHFPKYKNISSNEWASKIFLILVGKFNEEEISKECGDLASYLEKEVDYAIIDDVEDKVGIDYAAHKLKLFA